jgi:hypothetical protein
LRELKLATTTARPAADVTLQVVDVPEHPPDQPTKVLPVAGTAVSVTVVPEMNVPVHVDPQLIPAGVDVTVPDPVPARVTVMNGPLTSRFTPTVPVSSLPPLSVPLAVTSRVSVFMTADAVALMLSWIVPLAVLIVAGLKVTVVPSESPAALSVSGAVDVPVRVNVNVAGTVMPCLAVIRVGVIDRFTGMITSVPGPVPPSVAPSPPHVAASTMEETSNAWRIRDARRFEADMIRQSQCGGWTRSSPSTTALRLASSAVEATSPRTLCQDH